MHHGSPVPVAAGATSAAPIFNRDRSAKGAPLRGAGWSFLLLILASCTAPIDPTLRVGTSIWPGYEPLYLARDLGLYSDPTLRLVEYSSASEVLRAFRNKVIEVAALTLDEVLLLAETDGLETQVILVLDISNGADVLLGQPEVRSLADLRSRRVGVESSALGAYLLSRALASTNLTSSDVTPVRLGVDEQEEAFRTRRIDAVVTYEPVRTRLLAGGATQLFDSSQIPGEIVDVLVVSKSTIRNRPRALHALVAGWFAALDEIAARPDAAADRMSARLRLDREQVRATFELLQLTGARENIELLSGSSPTLAQSASRLGELMLTHQLLKRPPSTTSLVDGRFVAERSK